MGTPWGWSRVGSPFVAAALLNSSAAQQQAAVQDIVVWKGDLYFVDKPEPNPEELKGSLVAFVKNGVLQGTAYRYPASH